MHFGYFLVPEDDPNEHIMPDFLDDRIIKEFDEFFQPMTAAHIGKKVICQCTGVEWTFYSGKRFLVRAATLEAK